MLFSWLVQVVVRSTVKSGDAVAATWKFRGCIQSAARGYANCISLVQAYLGSEDSGRPPRRSGSEPGGRQFR